MSEDKKLTSEQAFEKWLHRSGSLEDSFKEAENLKVNSKESVEEDIIWQERLKTAITIEHQESLQAEHNVPEWDRAAAFETETTMAPIMIQGDHGPVAFKNIKYKLYKK